MRFRYSGIDEHGQHEQGEIESATEHDAFVTMHARGVTPISLTPFDAPPPPATPWYARDIAFSGKRIPLAHQIEFTLLMAVLLEMHLPIIKMIELLEESTRSRPLRQQLKRTAQTISQGSDFATAFLSGPAARQVSPLLLNALDVTEKDDERAHALRRVASTLGRQHRLRNTIAAALIYPAILVIAGFAVFALMAGYLAPTLAPMFESLGKPLPSGLAILMRINQVFSGSGTTVIILGGMGLVALASLLMPWATRLRNRIVDHLPLVGSLRNLTAIVGQIDALAIMLHGQVPLTVALDRLATQFQPDRHSGILPAAEAAQALRRGEPSAAPILAAVDVPLIVRHLYQLGEQTNRLPELLDAARQSLEAEIEDRAGRATQLLTPVLTLILGMGIGSLVYSMMGAILEINDLAF